MKKYLYSFLAGLLYGSWAFYANHTDGHAVRIAFTQGTMSLFFTSIMTFIMELSFNSRFTAMRLVRTVSTPMITVISIMIVGHLYIGTPHIIKTILPSIIIGTCFCLLYTSRLSINNNKTTLCKNLSN